MILDRFRTGSLHVTVPGESARVENNQTVPFNRPVDECDVQLGPE